MATVYILHSKLIDKFYIGSCLNLQERLVEHNTGKNQLAFSKRANDWKVFFKIDDLEYTQARKIEQHIKNMKSKAYIFNLTKHPEISEKLIEKYK